MAGGHFELGTDGPRVIVVGVDGSEVSLRAVAYAMGVARRHNGDVIAVKVESEVPATVGYGATLGLSLLPPACDGEQELQALLVEQLTADASTWSARVNLVVRKGDPATELAHVAQQSRADMVVVGASTSLAHRLSGSLPRRLYRQRRWVLTIVP